MPSNFQAAIQLIIAAATTSKPQKEAVLIVGMTPRGDDRQGVLRPRHAKGLLERLDVILSNPKALYKSDTVAGGSVVVTFEVKGENPIVVALHPNKMVGRTRCNVIASVYDKKADIEARWQQR
ncbi:hypothetical protein Q9L58_010927, partial [Maublancomyces gigas]